MSISFPPYENNVQTLTIPIRVLRTEAKVYANSFDFKRERVWTTAMKRSFIESLLYGLIVPDFFAIRKCELFWMFDGQQKFLATVEFFADGFAMPRTPDDPRFRITEANKRCSQLPQQLRDKLDNTIARINYIDREMEEWEAADLYRRSNSQKALQKPERLWSYPSETHKRTKEILDHPFWRKTYVGKQNHYKPFTAGLYIMFLEVPQKNANMTERRLREFAAGSHDNFMGKEIVEGIYRRLDDINHVFQGTFLESVKEVIPVYQAAQLLEQAGFSLRESEEGCLTAWYKEVQEASLRTRHTYGETDILSRINLSRYQIAFWTEQQSKIVGIEGLCYIDPKRGFSRDDRAYVMCLNCRTSSLSLPRERGQVHFILHLLLTESS